MRKHTEVFISDDNLDTEFRKRKGVVCALALEMIVNHTLAEKLWIDKIHDGWYKGEGKSTDPGMRNWTPQKIWKEVLEGDEEWNNELDYEIDLIVQDYYQNTGTVGYMVPGKRTIWVNTKFFDSNSSKKCVSNFFHEYLHTMGARHYGKYFRSSIAYFGNYYIEKVMWPLIEKDLKETEEWKAYIVEWEKRNKGKSKIRTPRRKKVCKRIWWKPWKKKCYWVNY